MGFLDDLKKTTINEDIAKVNTEFPEDGLIDGYMEFAESLIDNIKGNLTATVNSGKFQREGLRYCYSVTFNGDIGLGQGGNFANWKTAEAAFSEIEKVLNSENLSHEYYYEAVPLGYSYAKMVKLSGYRSFIKEMYGCMKRGWKYALKDRKQGKALSVRHRYQIVVKIYCDSKGVIK